MSCKKLVLRDDMLYVINGRGGFDPSLLPSGGGGGGVWGSITGILSDQTDLQSVLDTKAGLTTPVFVTNITTPLIVGGTGATSTLTFRPTSGVGTTNADIVFQVGNNGGTEAMRIFNGGNVAIGSTVNGSSKLQVTGAITATSEVDVSVGNGQSYYKMNGITVLGTTGSEHGPRIFQNNSTLFFFSTFGGTQIVSISAGGSLVVGFGHSSADASATLEVQSTTKGSIPAPKMTTAQKNAIPSPATGLMVIDTDLNKICVYFGSWKTVTDA